MCKPWHGILAVVCVKPRKQYAISTLRVIEVQRGGDKQVCTKAVSCDIKTEERLGELGY